MIQAPFVLPNQTQQNVDMSNEELLGKHMSLRKELSAAYTKPSWDAAHTNRIASELAAIERLLTSQKVTRSARSCPPSLPRRGASRVCRHLLDESTTAKSMSREALER